MGFDAGELAVSLSGLDAHAVDDRRGRAADRRTTNAAQSWAQVSTTNIAHGGIYSLYRNATSGLLVAATWNGMMRSTDNGPTWQNFATGLPYAGYETVFGDGVNLYAEPRGA